MSDCPHREVLEQFLDGRIEPAARLIEHVVESTVKTFGADSPRTFQARAIALTIRGKRGDLDGAVTGTRALLAETAESIPVHHPERLDSMTMLAMLFIEHKRHADAQVLLDEIMKQRRKTLSKDNLVLAATLVLHAECLIAAGKPAEAEIAAREALAVREKQLPPAHWLRPSTASLLGECLVEQKIIRGGQIAASREL